MSLFSCPPKFSINQSIIQNSNDLIESLLAPTCPKNFFIVQPPPLHSILLQCRHMSYRIVETGGNETLAEIAARENIPYSLGTGFYQLKKVLFHNILHHRLFNKIQLQKESISGEKKLILWNGTEFDDVNARKTLGYAYFY